MLSVGKTERKALYSFLDAILSPVWSQMSRDEAVMTIKILDDSFGNLLACALLDSVNRCHREGLLKGQSDG